MADLTRCSQCNAVTRYEDRSRVSPLGWLFFLLAAAGSVAGAFILKLDPLLYFGLPASLLGLFIRDRYRVCPKCNVRIAQLG